MSGADQAPMTAPEAAEMIGPLLRAFRGLQRGEELLGAIAAADNDIAERRARIAGLEAGEQAHRDRIAADFAAVAQAKAESLVEIADTEKRSRERIASAEAAANAAIDAAVKRKGDIELEIAALAEDRQRIARDLEAEREAAKSAIVEAREARDRDLKALSDQVAAKSEELAAVEDKLARVRASMAAMRSSLEVV